MLWLMTDDAPDFVDRLRAAGETVHSDPAEWVSTQQPNIHHPRDYRVRALVQQHKPDVVVLVEPLRLWTIPGGLLEWGYYRHQTQDIRQTTTMVYLVSDDPATWWAFETNRAPGCACRPEDASVYVSGDPDTVRRVKAKKPAALWRPGMDLAPVLAAVAFRKARRTYQGKRDAGLW